jgi:hypothetical protein
MPEGQRLVISYKGGMDADDGDTLVFDQGSTASPDGRFLLEPNPITSGRTPRRRSSWRTRMG